MSTLSVSTQVSNSNPVPAINQQGSAQYTAGQTVTQTLVIKAGSQFSPGVGFSTLTLTTSAVLQLTATKGTDTTYLNQEVSQQIVVDDTVDQFFLTNSGTVNASVQMVYVVATGTTTPVAGIVTSVNTRDGAVTLSLADIPGAAPEDSPEFTGNPTVPTPPAGDSSATIPNTEWVTQEIEAATDLAQAKLQIVATADGQTLFPVPGGYTGSSQIAAVYLLGAWLTLSQDYTLPDLVNVEITADNAALVKAGDILTVVKQTTFSVADAVSASALSASTGALLVGYEGSTVGATLDKILTTAFRNVEILVATADGQADFTVPDGYVPNAINTYYLGAYLTNSVDYTGTDGTTIQLVASLATQIKAGDSLVVERFQTFEVADAVSTTTLGASTGASLIGYGTSTVSQTLDGLKGQVVADYAGLRSYTGDSNQVLVTHPLIAGPFVLDAADTTSADDGGIVIVDSSSRRWKRASVTVINAMWFTYATGYVLNSAAVAAAFTAAKQGSTIPKIPVYANGVTVDQPLVFDGGDDLVHNADLGCLLDVTLLGVQVTPGIGTAITIRNARKPRWRVSIIGSGTEHNEVDTSTPPQVVLSGTDIGVSHYNVEGAEFDVEAYNFRGILSYYNGANGQWLENKRGRVLGRTCFQTLNWTGNTTTGDAAVGVIDSVWDVIPFFRSQISWLGDLNLFHYESSVVNTFQIAGGSLEISHVGSCHLGKVNLGNNAQYMLRIFGASAQVDIDELYCLGNGTVVNGKSNGDSTTNGLEISDTSFVSIGAFVGSQCNTAFAVDGGSRLAISTFNGNNNTWDMALQQGVSTSLSMDIDIGTYHSNGVYNGSIQYRGNVTGRLAIDKGFIRNGNVTGATTIPAIDLNGVSASFFFAPGGLTIDTSWTIGVRHYYLGCVLAKGGNQIACSTPLIDSFGHLGEADLVSLVMPLPTAPPVIGTTYQNVLPFPMLLYVPINFGSASVAGDFASIKLTSTGGTIYDLASRVSVNTASLPDIRTLGPVLVPPGWSFTISASNTGTNRVALQSTQAPYWIRT